jgi:hypothetical protein
MLGKPVARRGRVWFIVGVLLALALIIGVFRNESPTKSAPSALSTWVHTTSNSDFAVTRSEYLVLGAQIRSWLHNPEGFRRGPFESVCLNGDGRIRSLARQSSPPSRAIDLAWRTWLAQTDLAWRYFCLVPETPANSAQRNAAIAHAEQERGLANASVLRLINLLRAAGFTVRQLPGGPTP